MCASSSARFVLRCTVLWQLVEEALAFRDNTPPTRQPQVYEEFRALHRAHDAAEDNVPYAQRMALFELRSAAVQKHNSRGALWQATVNRFADFTDEELKAMLGYRRGLRSGTSATFGSLMEETSEVTHKRGSLLRNHKVTVTSMDWRDRLSAARTFVRDQGPCGSCWAVAAIGAVEAHLELAGNAPTQLSFKHLVNCVPNPDHCGGTGGCSGGTGELAMEWMQSNSVAAESDYDFDLRGPCPVRPVPPMARVDSFEVLPRNRYWPLLNAVASHGPVVGSVDASKWHSYHDGVFDGCGRDAILNHAALVVGFGEDATGTSYWLIRNSWGRGWGQGGYMRLLRYEEDGYCGLDTDAHKGIACDGEPDEVRVCGMCGIHFDSVIPGKVFLANSTTGLA